MSTRRADAVRVRILRRPSWEILGRGRQTVAPVPISAFANSAARRLGVNARAAVSIAGRLTAIGVANAIAPNKLKAL